ncbi:lipocalin [Maribrevibacterium harenarium]|uniref:Outer membrane lipoprotein Blc n=1 Tax=Maribrevibacterium harenarium TaxID=2589817 RepID=A0A501X497_9GAMM|nr:lipocalin family protein [Maribrevibacterium harenarium]TPE55336.1 lipocalin [Maribrevibacterium harenarium]
MRSFFWLVSSLILLTGCTTAPKGITPITDFELSRYLGTWYEIARLDHSFERGLAQVSANYSLREDGGVKVINRGFNVAEQEWEQAEGKAYFVKDPTTGHLKVSFFGPFYGAYVIFDLDSDYQQAYVAGPDRSYLWYLSRTPIVSDEDKQRFLTRVKAEGFDTKELIFVEQTPP